MYINGKMGTLYSMWDVAVTLLPEMESRESVMVLTVEET
jgi:hypothetical protein